MKAMPLCKFQSLTALPDSAIMALLRSNQLKCQYSDEQGLLIEISNIALDRLIATLAQRQNDLLANKRSLVVERMASIISEQLDSLANEALKLVSMNNK